MYKRQVIGIDVGGSTTKIVGVENKTIKSPMFVKATDPVTSLFGAFGKYIYDNGITLPEIEIVMLTGVGSAFIDQPLYGLSLIHIFSLIISFTNSITFV